MFFLKKGKKRRSFCCVRHIFLRLLQCCIGKTWIRCNLTKSVSKSLKPWVSVPAHMFWDQTNNNAVWVCASMPLMFLSQLNCTAHQFASSSAAIRIVETHVHYCLRWIFSFCFSSAQLGSVWFGLGCNGSGSISSTRYRLMSGNSSKSRASERINTRFEGYSKKVHKHSEIGFHIHHFVRRMRCSAHTHTQYVWMYVSRVRSLAVVISPQQKIVSFDGYL